LDVQAGDLVQLRDHSDRIDVVQELLLALERRGATPLLQLLPSTYLQRLLASTDPGLLGRWDQRRIAWLEATDRILVLAGVGPDLSEAPADALGTWHQAIVRLTHAEERRCIPSLLAAIPTNARAEQLGLSLSELEDLLAPALSASPSELQLGVDRVLAALEQAHTLTIRSGASSVLQLDLGGRRWLSDNGAMPGADARQPGTQAVLNLPAGAVYTTVVETATQGTLWLGDVMGAQGVALHFDGGRVVAIEAAQGAEKLESMFDQHTGEPRRLSHIGVGLNPYLQRSIGWTLVDEHRHGALIIAFGENRYLGGQNESSLNVDFSLSDADLLAGQRTIVLQGQVVVD
jgi:leucyl aminopeptidase (aminopeptidase T)